jgi:hypothetical protein
MTIEMTNLFTKDLQERKQSMRVRDARETNGAVRLTGASRAAR